jgi:hypothetical protein
MIETPDFAGSAFDRNIAQGDLAIATHGDAASASHTHDRGRVKLFHTSPTKKFSRDDAARRVGVKKGLKR